MAATEATTRWTVEVSTSVDLIVRDFLSDHGASESDLAAFVEEAVQWRVLQRTVAETRRAFADLPPGELETMIDEAVLSDRAVRRLD